MGKSRSLGFFVKSNKLSVGDSFKTTPSGSNRIVEFINKDTRVVQACGVSHNFSEKVYLANEPDVVSPAVKVKFTAPRKNYTISFSATVDFEFVDNESESIEEALAKVRKMKDWELITKGTLVDSSSGPEIFAVIENVI